MSDLAALYQEVIVDHSNRARNRRVIEGACSAEGSNPLCGDEITVYLALDGDVISDVSFESHSCAISTASASLMTEALRGKTRAQAVELFDAVHHMLISDEPGGDDIGRVGKLTVLAGVREYPMRVKCATLAWHTFIEALESGSAPTATEES